MKTSDGKSIEVQDLLPFLRSKSETSLIEAKSANQGEKCEVQKWRERDLMNLEEEQVARPLTICADKRGFPETNNSSNNRFALKISDPYQTGSDGSYCYRNQADGVFEPEI